MAPTTAKSEAFRRLADVLEEGRPWTVEDSLRLVRNPETHRAADQVRLGPAVRRS